MVDEFITKFGLVCKMSHRGGLMFDKSPDYDASSNKWSSNNMVPTQLYMEAGTVGRESTSERLSLDIEPNTIAEPLLINNNRSKPLLSQPVTISVTEHNKQLHFIEVEHVFVLKKLHDQIDLLQSRCNELISASTKGDYSITPTPDDLDVCDIVVENSKLKTELEVLENVCACQATKIVSAEERLFEIETIAFNEHSQDSEAIKLLKTKVSSLESTVVQLTSELNQYHKQDAVQREKERQNKSKQSQNNVDVNKSHLFYARRSSSIAATLNDALTVKQCHINLPEIRDGSINGSKRQSKTDSTFAENCHFKLPKSKSPSNISDRISLVLSPNDNGSGGGMFRSYSTDGDSTLMTRSLTIPILTNKSAVLPAIDVARPINPIIRRQSTTSVKNRRSAVITGADSKLGNINVDGLINTPINSRSSFRRTLSAKAKQNDNLNL